MIKKTSHGLPGYPVPYTCRILMLMALTYYGIINLLFLGMLVFSGRIRRATEPWFEAEGLSNRTLMIFIIFGVVVLLLCTSGIFLMMRRNKGGFYMYLAGAIFLWITDFFLLEFDWMRYLLNSGFIFMVGILHFTGKCYRQVKNSPKKSRSPKTSVGENEGVTPS